MLAGWTAALPRSEVSERLVVGAWERPALVHRRREPKSVKPTVSVLRGKCTVYEIAEREFNFRYRSYGV